MIEEERHALIPLPSADAIEKISTGPGGILSRMVSDALAMARSQVQPLAEARFQIGNYELREPDYRQISMWAKALELEPVEIIQRLESSSCENLDGAAIRFRVEDGSIVTLAWDFYELPISIFEWVDGLEIREIAFMGSRTAPCQITLRLPSLALLNCADIGLTEIDLSNVARLTSLRCSNNQLIELNLSNVAGLTELWCHNNQLTGLDLPNVAGLTSLSCSNNQLTELDLSNVAGLTELDCDNNQLTGLDLSNVASLTRLWCSHNQLTALDLSQVAGLTRLWCSDNQLTELNLSNVVGLIELHCYNNQLTKLDLSNVAGLTELDCDNNQLTGLDLSNVASLTKLSCSDNQLTALDLSQVAGLAELYCDNNQLTELGFSSVVGLTGHNERLTGRLIATRGNAEERDCQEGRPMELKNTHRTLAELRRLALRTGAKLEIGNEVVNPSQQKFVLEPRLVTGKLPEPPKSTSHILNSIVRQVNRTHSMDESYVRLLTEKTEALMKDGVPEYDAVGAALHEVQGVAKKEKDELYQAIREQHPDLFRASSSKS